MKLIEPAVKKTEGDRLQHYFTQFSQKLTTSKTSEQSEQAIIARFLRNLDDRFLLLHNLQPEGFGVPIPALLIGPSGMMLINISDEKGFFRVEGEAWEKMDRTNRFRPARINLIQQTQDYARRLGMILDVHGKAHPEIVPILLFAKAGVNIESTKPAIRIVLMDGVDSLLSSFLHGHPTLTTNEINYLSESVELLANPDKALPKGETEDFFGRDFLVAEKKPSAKTPVGPRSEKIPFSPNEKKLKFTQKQWVTMVIVLMLTIIVLLVVILIIVSIF